MHFKSGDCDRQLDNLFDAALLLTIGSFLLTTELFYLQLTVLAFLLAVGGSQKNQKGPKRGGSKAEQGKASKRGSKPQRRNAKITQNIT